MTSTCCSPRIPPPGERCGERLSHVVVEGVTVEGPVREEDERNQVPFGQLPSAQDLREIIRRHADCCKSDAEHCEEDTQLKGSRAVSARDRIELEDAEEVRQPADDDDEEPGQEKRQFRDCRLLAAHSPPPKVIASKKFPVFASRVSFVSKSIYGIRD